VAFLDSDGGNHGRTIDPFRGNAPREGTLHIAGAWGKARRDDDYSLWRCVRHGSGESQGSAYAIASDAC